MSQKSKDSLFSDNAVAPENTASHNPAPLSATSDEDIEANKLRATNLYFAGPMYDLIPNAAKEPFHLLDHHTLSMHAFDYVHQNLGFGSHEQGGVKKDDLVTHVAHLVEQQLHSLRLGNTDHAGRRDIRDYAASLVDNLLNDGGNRKFEFRVFNPALNAYETKDFILLREVDTWDNTLVIRPTTQGVNLYLNLLPRNIESTEIALDAILRDQLRRGKIPDAARTAREWRLVAYRYREEMLEFKRSIALNISKISWVVDIEPRIAELEEDIKKNRRKVESILNDVEITPNTEFVQLRNELTGCQNLYQQLDELVIGLPRSWLIEHTKQSFLPAAKTRMPNMLEEVLAPLLLLTTEDLDDASINLLIACLGGPTAPSAIDMMQLFGKAMAPRKEYDPANNHQEPEFHDLEEQFVTPITESDARWAWSILDKCLADPPVRLSRLFDEAGQQGAPEGVLIELCLTAIEAWRCETPEMDIIAEKTDRPVKAGKIWSEDFLLQRVSTVKKAGDGEINGTQ